MQQCRFALPLSRLLTQTFQAPRALWKLSASPLLLAQTFQTCQTCHALQVQSAYLLLLIQAVGMLLVLSARTLRVPHFLQKLSA